MRCASWGWGKGSWFICASFAFALIMGCGARKRSTSSPVDIGNMTLEDLTPEQRQAIPNDDGTDGTGDGSDEPYPLACQITARNCLDAPATEVSTCPHIIGEQLPCSDFEGFCFVKDRVTPIYRQNPPTSGPAYKSPEWQWYEHETPVARGRYVHNLAHGFVVFAYHCPQGCPAEVNALIAIRKDPKYAGLRLIITPDPELQQIDNSGANKFAAIAWRWRYLSDNVDPQAFACFLLQHVSDNNRYPH